MIFIISIESTHMNHRFRLPGLSCFDDCTDTYKNTYHQNLPQQYDILLRLSPIRNYYFFIVLTRLTHKHSFGNEVLDVSHKIYKAMGKFYLYIFIIEDKITERVNTPGL